MVFYAPIAQGIEQLPSKQWVGGSIPPGRASVYSSMVDVAQLVRAPVCGTGGRGFEPHYPPHFVPLFRLERGNR